MKALFLTLSILMAGATSQGAPLSRAEKQAMIDQLRTCPSHCDGLAQELLSTYKKLHYGSRAIINKNATYTILYFHSYTLSPDEDSFYLDNEKFNGANVIAPLLTAHHIYSTAEDFKNVTSEDWLTDAELGFHFAAALGKPIVLKGFSLGGLLATEMALRHPDKISKLILLAPALMIRNRINHMACKGQSEWVQSLVKSFTSAPKDFVEKYLSGACAVTKTMQTVTSRIPLRLTTAYGEPTSNDIYFARLAQLKELAAQIQVPTQIIFGRGDEAVDIRALESFANGLRRGDVAELPESVTHMDTLDLFMRLR